MRRFLTFAAIGILIIALSSCGDKEESAAVGQCDRQCLEGYVNQYLEAMVAHDASLAPFAENARFTENAKDIYPTKSPSGLWVEAKGLTDYKFYIADPRTGQIAFVGA